MRTLMVVGGGLVVLAIFMLIGRQLGGVPTSTRAALWFIPVWLAAAGYNLFIGTRHGYSVAEELPVGLLVFGAPAAVALLFWWKFSKGST